MNNVIESFVGIALMIIIVAVPILPILMAIAVVKEFKEQGLPVIYGIISIVLSVIPPGILIYIIYYGLTCGSGCFSGAMFIIPLGASFLILIVLIIILLFAPKISFMPITRVINKKTLPVFFLFSLVLLFAFLTQPGK